MEGFSLKEINRITKEARNDAEEKYKKESEEVLKKIKNKIFLAAKEGNSTLDFTSVELNDASFKAINYALIELFKLGFSVNTCNTSGSYNRIYQYTIKWNKGE